ncbi:DUF3841 domain-containing protein [Candidatus Uhrbacteria bacterium]|nr:DUF3841 domain-containing protein [Candidatus Uhrbacteria bacterium]
MERGAREKSRSPDEDRIRLWTIQSERAWEVLQRDGVLRADGRYSDSGFRTAYRWMIAEMTKRVPGYSGRFPLWAWHTPKPDLRHTAHVPRGQCAVRIECLLPRAEVLLSDFDGWHFVLNRLPFTWTKREDDAWDQRLSLPYQLLSSELRSEVERSWERAFELRRPRGSRAWLGNLDAIQATFAELRMEDVVRVTPFVGR